MQEMVLIPKSTLIELIVAYKTQAAVNVLLYQEHKDLNAKVDTATSAGFMCL